MNEDLVLVQYFIWFKYQIPKFPGGFKTLKEKIHQMIIMFFCSYLLQ